LYADGAVSIRSSLVASTNKGIYFGNSYNAAFVFSTVQATANSLLCCLGSASKSLIITDMTFINKDHDHSAQANPTIFVHSATDPDSDNTEWMSIAHNVTDAVITSGKGAINLIAATSVVNIGATLNMTTESTIATTANGKLHFVPNGTGYVCIGSGTSGQHSLSGNGDCYIEGDVEIDGIAYADAC